MILGGYIYNFVVVMKVIELSFILFYIEEQSLHLICN